MSKQTITQLGASPETLIDQLRSSLNELIAKAHRIKPSENLNAILDKMKDLYFKLNMAKLTNDKTILSITGLQGVGKTKIIRDLYNLDDTLLPSDGGRGEVLPVLFTETPYIDTPVYFVRRAYRNEDGIYELKDIEVSLSELNAISRDPHKDDLWLEVRLPQTHFNTEISLALLPGFEKDQSQLSQKYLETFLTLSTSVLLVFNHKKLAQQDQQILIQKTASDYKESAPVFALSFAEELNEQERENLQSDLCKKFNIPGAETDRIVFTGTSSELKDYPKYILDAIHKYSLTNADGYKKQLRLLSTLTSEIRILAGALEQEIQTVKMQTQIKWLDSQEDNSNLNIHEIRQRFYEYRKKTTTQVRSAINSTFLNHVNDCAEEMNDKIENEKNNLLDKIKSAFNKNTSFEEKREFERQVKLIWNGANEVESEQRLIKSLDSFVSTQLQKLDPPKNDSMTTIKVNPLLAPVAHNGGILVKANSNEAVEAAVSNINRYINGDKNDLSITLSNSDLKVLPVIAVGLAQELIAASLILDYDKFDQLDKQTQNNILNKSQTLVTEFQDLALSTSNVVKGAALFFGIDALDGTFNTFGALTSVLTSLGVSSAAATPIGLLIVGTIGSSLAIHKGSERIEKYKFERSQMATAYFSSVAATQEESVIATINNILDNMEEKLIDTYHLRRGTDKNFGLLDELDHRLNRLQHLCGEMQELTFRNEAYIY